ncbi:MAG: hypothetical protein Q8R04_03160 [Nanoarchaeota archaeon]|nr:hypothetical protein [Nanoarchaeota archaeon]
MLFFKPKQKSNEVLPPPPPFPTLEFEEEKERPKFFDETIKPKKAETFPEEGEFSNLVENLGKEVKQKKMINKKKKMILEKTKAAKRQKIPIKKKQKQFKKITSTNRIKEKRLISSKKSKISKKAAEKPNAVEQPELEEDFWPENLGSKLPKESASAKNEEELPEKSEEFDIEGFAEELKQETKAKPKEIVEAEEEIKSAIEKIKEREKPSFFKKLFTRKKTDGEFAHGYSIQELPEVDKISMIQNKINETRQALMKFDLETAKSSYIGIMKLYQKIRPEEQAKVYHDIRDLYFERKSAEELKV